MPVDASLDPWRERLEPPLTADRAALAHGQLLMATLDALRPHLYLRPLTALAKAMAPRSPQLTVTFGGGQTWLQRDTTATSLGASGV